MSACRFCDSAPKHLGLRLCGTHYQRWLRAGKPDLPKWDGEPTTRRECEVCGAGFRPERGAKTCSEPCKIERQRRKWRAYWHGLDGAQREKVKADTRQRRKDRPQVYRAIDRRRNVRIAADPDRQARKNARARESHRRRRLAAGLTVRGTNDGRSKRIRPPCSICGSKLPLRRVRYCCDECARLARLARGAGEGVLTGMEGLALAASASAGRYRNKCRHCGTEFHTNNLREQLCSEVCRRAVYAARKRKGPARIDAKCAVCSRNFLATKKNATTCSECCRAEDKRRKMRTAGATPEARARQKLLARARHGVKAACTICGRDMSDFENLRINRFTCSETCRVEAVRRRNRRSYESRKQRSSH